MNTLKSPNSVHRSYYQNRLSLYTKYPVTQFSSTQISVIAQPTKMSLKFCE